MHMTYLQLAVKTLYMYIASRPAGLKYHSDKLYYNVSFRLDGDGNSVPDSGSTKAIQTQREGKVAV